MPVPISEHDGPTDPTIPDAHGYQHSPQGAALAAIGSTIRMSVADDTQWPKVLRTLVASGTARDSWSVNRLQVSITAPVPESDAPTVLGYRIGRYSADRAELSIVTRQSDGSLTSNAATVAWQDGDWRLVLPEPNAPAQVSAIGAVPSDLVTLPPRS